MINIYQITLPFASISRKKVNADFVGSTLFSDREALFLREFERGIGVIQHLVEALKDQRNQSFTDQSYLGRNLDFLLSSLIKPAPGRKPEVSYVMSTVNIMLEEKTQNNFVDSKRHFL